MGVDVADEPVLQSAFDRIAPSVREDVAGIGVDVDLLHRSVLRTDLAVNVHTPSPPA